MKLCSSALITLAFTIAILLADLWNRRSDRMFAHLFLGGVITALFTGLCQYGYEIVNWGFLALVPITLLLIWASTYLYLPTGASNVIAIPASDFGNCTTCSQPPPPSPSCGEPMPSCG
jgi:hypothetical protein